MPFSIPGLEILLSVLFITIVGGLSFSFIADNEFPDEAIEPTLKQLSENLKKGSRSGSKVKIKIRKLEKVTNDVSKPVIIGEIEKSFTMN